MNVARIILAFLIVAIPGLVSAGDDAPDPAKLKDKVKIEVGKKIVVRFDQDGDKLSKPTVVQKVGEKPLTPTFEFKEMEGSLFLTTKNPFTKDMKFRALARIKGRKDYFETSIVPVKAGLFGIELWPDPIEELILFDFKLVEEK